MSGDSGPFCNRINDAGRVIVNPGMDDLHRLVDRIRTSGQFSVSLERTGDMDSGIELISTLEGTAILGCEESLRGTFAFYYYDPMKTAKLLEIEWIAEKDANPPRRKNEGLGPT